MKLYYWNLLSLGLTLLSWVIARLGYMWLPKSWYDFIWHLGFLVYLVAFAVLGWGAVRVVWLAIQGSMVWSRSLWVVGVAFVQAVATLGFFIILLAEGFHQEK